MPQPTFGVRKGAGASPRNGRPSQRRPALGKGWAGWRKNAIRVCDRARVRPGPWAMVWLSLRCIQDWDCRLYAMPCAPSGPTASGRHSQPTKTRPMMKLEKIPCLSSNRSTMESMIDSGKIHMVDPAVESQPGRATNNTGSRSRPKRALNYPFLPITRRVPMMRNRRGILCSPDTGFRK